MALTFQAVEGAVGSVSNTVQNTIAGNVSWLAVGIALFIAAAIVIYFLKNIVINTAVGLMGWGVLTYVFHVQLPFLASLLVSAIFGLAGLGALLVLAFLGIIQ